MKTSKVKTNRRRATSGRDWGWVETPTGENVLFWEGDLERAQATSRAAELDRIGWEMLGDDERAQVRHGAMGDCELVHLTRKRLGDAMARADELARQHRAAVESVERLREELDLRINASTGDPP